MKRKVFSVYDVKAEAYLQPFFMDTQGLAIRGISECVNDPEHTFYKHTSDYDLFLLGEFDDSSGQFIGEKKSLGNLIEYKTMQEKPTKSNNLSVVEVEKCDP